jgi:hypothetical protein
MISGAVELFLCTMKIDGNSCTFAANFDSLGGSIDLGSRELQDNMTIYLKQESVSIIFMQLSIRPACDLAYLRGSHLFSSITVFYLQSSILPST